MSHILKEFRVVSSCALVRSAGVFWLIISCPTSCFHCSECSDALLLIQRPTAVSFLARFGYLSALFVTDWPTIPYLKFPLAKPARKLQILRSIGRRTASDERNSHAGNGWPAAAHLAHDIPAARWQGIRSGRREQ